MENKDKPNPSGQKAQAIKLLESTKGWLDVILEFPKK